MCIFQFKIFIYKEKNTIIFSKFNHGEPYEIELNRICLEGFIF